MNETIAGIRSRALACLIPPARLALSEWIEANIRLAGSTAMPGPMRLWPWQREIADAIGDPTIERVSLQKPTRVGFTSLLIACLASHVVNDPAPVLVLQPTESDARDFIVSDVEPLFRASGLFGRLALDREGPDRATLMHRIYPGGSLKVVASRAPRNLRRHTVRILLIDECDAMESGPEGSPIRLAEQRTLSFANRKIVIGSTPLLADTSNVVRAYAQSDQRIYECCCPRCSGFTELLWRHIEWEPDRPETAQFRCPHCASLIPEHEKPAMVEAGRWRATAQVEGHAGFKLNALVSFLGNASWAKLAAEFLVAKDDPAQLQVFVNTALAEPWNEAEAEISESDLASRAEGWSLNAIPPEVLAVTVGVDLQDDRLEASIVGWSRTDALVLAHVVVWGQPTDDTTWMELDELLRTRWTHPHGGRLKVDACVVGAGYMPDIVYAFCHPRSARRIMAGKGVAGTRSAITVSQSKVKGGRLWIVGVDGLKAQILTRLARGSTIRFSNTLEPAYYEQLASERRVIRYSRGQPVRQFVRKAGARAEALDALVYSFAARHAVQIVFDQREQELASPTPPKAAPVVIRSKWLDGGL